MYRTHHCGELNASHINQTVTLCGWVHKSRDKGFVAWVDLRDRYGITQLVFDADRTDKNLMEAARNLGREFVIQVTGTVIERASKNPNMPTGEIEILVNKYEVLNESAPLPFILSSRDNSEENLRLKYRYLELRMDELQYNMFIRHKAYQETRKFLSKNNFTGMVDTTESMFKFNKFETHVIRGEESNLKITYKSDLENFEKAII